MYCTWPTCMDYLQWQKPAINVITTCACNIHYHIITLALVPALRAGLSQQNNELIILLSMQSICTYACHIYSKWAFKLKCTGMYKQNDKVTCNYVTIYLSYVYMCRDYLQSQKQTICVITTCVCTIRTCICTTVCEYQNYTDQCTMFKYQGKLHS